MPKHTRKILRHKYKILAVSYTLWLTVISLIPLNNLNLPSFSYADKIVHFFLYFFLVLFWLRAYPDMRLKKWTLFICAVLLGIIIEFLQEYFIPGRSGDIFDALANTLGALSGLVFSQRFIMLK